MQHATDDRLERYAMRTLPRRKIGPLEEHLLTCSECRNRLQAEIDLVTAMREVATEVKEEERKEDGVGDGATRAGHHGSLRHSRKVTHFCLNRVAHRRQRAFCPQTEDRAGDIIPAAGGLPGSGFVSKVWSFPASAEGQPVVRECRPGVAAGWWSA